MNRMVNRKRINIMFVFVFVLIVVSVSSCTSLNELNQKFFGTDIQNLQDLSSFSPSFSLYPVTGSTNSQTNSPLNNTNTITNVSDVVISGILTINSNHSVTSIEININNENSWQSVEIINNKTNWTKTLALSEGLNTIQIRIIIDNNITNTSTAVINVIMDKTPPMVNIDQTNGQEVGSSYTFSGTVNDDMSGMSNVSIQLDNGTISEVAFTTNGKWNANYSNITYGKHTNTVYAEDAAGNIATNSIWIERKATPVVSISTPTDGSFLQDEIVTFNGTSSVDSPYSITKVQLSTNESAYFDTTRTTNWNANITLSEGTNTIQARTIADNNKTNTSTAIDVIVDTTAPTVSINQTDGQEVGSSYTFSGTVSDNLSGMSNVSVQLDNGTISGILFTGGVWNKNYIGVTYGKHTNTVYAEDVLGNITTNSIWVERKATPVVSISTPTDGSVTNVAIFTVNGVASVDIPYSITKVQLSTNGSAYFDTTGTTNWNANITLSEGTNTIQARAIADNNKTNTSTAIDVIVDTTPPTLSIDQTDGQEVGSSYTFSGTVSDDLSDISNISVQLDNGTFSEVVFTGGVWNTNYNNVTYGKHTNTVYAEDVLGNITTNSIWVERKATPMVSISTPTDRSWLNDEIVTFNGVASVNSPYSITKVQLSTNESAYFDTTGTTNWSITIDLTVSMDSEYTNIVIARAIASSGKTNTSTLVNVIVNTN